MIPDESPLGEAGLAEDVSSQIASGEKPDTGSPTEPVERSSLLELWERLSQAGLAESALRLGTHTLLLALILLVAWSMRQFYSLGQVPKASSDTVLAAELPTPL